MSRLLGGICFAVVALGSMVLFAQDSAAGGAGDPLAKFEQQTQPKAAEDKIEAVLKGQLKTPLDFVEVPLDEVLDFIQDEYELPVVFDNVALEEMAISPDTEITINLRGVSLRSALNLIFSHPRISDLDYVIKDEVLLITTDERARANMELQLYRVDDFELFPSAPGRGGAASESFSPLTEVITSTINHDSWAVHESGEGVICVVRPGILVVYNTRDTHQKIRELLTNLRQLAKEIDSQVPIESEATAALVE